MLFPSPVESRRVSHKNVLDTIRDQQGKDKQLQDGKLLLEKLSANKAKSRVRNLEARVRRLEEDNSQKGKLSELEKQQQKLVAELASEKILAKEEVEKLKAERASAISDRLADMLVNFHLISAAK